MGTIRRWIWCRDRWVDGKGDERCPSQWRTDGEWCVAGAGGRGVTDGDGRAAAWGAAQTDVWASRAELALRWVLPLGK